MSSLISAVSWVRRGVAAQHPAKYVLDESELERVSKLARIELEDARVELEKAQRAAMSMEHRDDDVHDGENDTDWVDEDDDGMDVDSTKDVPNRDDDDLAEYKLDEYDDESDSAALGPFSNIKGLTYYRNNDEDPYITLKDDPEDDERTDLEILPTDNLLVTAKTEDEISQLEIYVYEASQENLYVHHDLMLPSFPLCLEWLDFPPTSITSTSNGTAAAPAARQFGNYIAVGTLDPEIEIWSLDVIDAMYPDTILGRPPGNSTPGPTVPTALSTSKKKKKKKKKKNPHGEYFHTDAVLSLSWNKTHRNLLASASADHTVKLWDLSREPYIVPSSTPGEDSDSDAISNANGTPAGGAIRSFGLHTDKVQSVQWNGKDPTVLLSGSYDRTVRVFDSRAPTAGVGAVVGSDVEAMRWDPWDLHNFYVSLENGLVLAFDARTLPSKLSKPSPALFTLAAHDGAASALDVNPHIRGCIVTGGMDKVVKIWNILDGGGEGKDKTTTKKSVSLVTSRDLGVGKIFSTVFSPDDPLTVAAAGSKAKLQIWNVGTSFGVRKTFGDRLREAGFAFGKENGWRRRKDKMEMVEEDQESECQDGRERGGGIVGLLSDGESDEE